MNPLVIIDLLKSKYLWGAVVTLGLILWAHHAWDAALSAQYKQGKTDGNKEVQGKWDADKARIEREEEKKATENALAEKAAQKHKQEIDDANQAQLADAQHRADDFARRLRDAYATAAGDYLCPVQADRDRSKILAPGGGQSEDGLGRAVAAYRAECDRNAAALNNSFKLIDPQLRK